MRKFIAPILILALTAILTPRANAKLLGKDPSTAATKNLPFDPHDLTGVWGFQSAAEWVKGEPPMTPWEAARYHSEKTQFTNPPTLDGQDTDPLFHCDPVGIPKPYMMAWPIQIVQTPSEVVVLFAMHSNYIEAYLNADHAKNPGHTWFGDSTAKWEGNTLVVDTVGFNDRTWYDRHGHSHSDQMHLVQRFTRVDHDHLKYEMTTDDPKAYTQAWGGERDFTLDPTGAFDEYICSPSDEQQMINKVMDPEATPKDAPVQK